MPYYSRNVGQSDQAAKLAALFIKILSSCERIGPRALLVSPTYPQLHAFRVTAARRSSRQQDQSALVSAGFIRSRQRSAQGFNSPVWSLRLCTHRVIHPTHGPPRSIRHMALQGALQGPSGPPLHRALHPTPFRRTARPAAAASIAAPAARRFRPRGTPPARLSHTQVLARRPGARPTQEHDEQGTISPRYRSHALVPCAMCLQGDPGVLRVFVRLVTACNLK